MSSELSVDTDDGLSLFVRTDGRQRGNAPLVCLPGLTRNSRDFTQVAERFSPLRFVVRIDFRGRGGSSFDPTAQSYTPERYVRDTILVLDALGIATAVLLGTSLGGSIAMLTASLHPMRVAGAILNDVGPKLEPAGFARIQSYAGKLPTNGTWAEAVTQLRSLRAPGGTSRASSFGPTAASRCASDTATGAGNQARKASSAASDSGSSSSGQ